jgi:hypothetical protein
LRDWSPDVCSSDLEQIIEQIRCEYFGNKKME